MLGRSYSRWCFCLWLRPFLCRCFWPLEESLSSQNQEVTTFVDRFCELNTRVLSVFQRVKAARHVIDPNPGFLAQLKRYEEELNRC